MALSDQILDELKKALNKVQSTSTTLQTWQEPFDRQGAVSPEVVQAAKAIEGFAGSWAAQASIVSNTEYAAFASAADPQVVTNHLGRPGQPETNFPLYAWGTNKDDEAAFLGHPISFSIVGPTARHQSMDWQWVYSTAGGTEFLTLDTVAFNSRPLPTPPVAPLAADILQAYGLSSMPDEGLYFVVSLTGSSSSLDNSGVPTPGGVGDGIIYTDGGRAAVTEKNFRSSRYEIFRINDFVGNQFELDTNKRFSDYFTIPGGTPIVRAITLFKPFAARMASIPSVEGAGKNRAFLTVTPEKSANGDLLPTYGGSTNVGTWLGSGFAKYDLGLRGTAGTYGGEVALPVFVPKRKGTARLATNRYTTAGGLPMAPGQFQLTNITTTATAGDIICVRSVSQPNFLYGYLYSLHGSVDSTTGTGYYEITSVVGSTVTCRALPRVNPETGLIFYGPLVHNCQIDLDGTPIPATAAVQYQNAVASVAGITYTITFTLDTNLVVETFTYTTLGGEDSWAIANALAALINAGAYATATLNPAVGPSLNTTIELATKGSYVGPLGNGIQIAQSNDSVAPQVTGYRSGRKFGTSDGQDGGYTGTITPKLGVGIGVNDYAANVEYTLHDPVPSLWQGVFDPVKVQANRLPNLIDPTWNKRALSKLANVQNPAATVAGRADKAIFDTSKGTKGAANPGSMLDLGFRMVLFPAKDDGFGNAAPDYDNPITTQNVILDPTVNEAQYIYIDYASGAVVCSHTPDPTNPLCTLAPNGIVGTGGNNPRGDIVLFASCVPFSRMPQQTGGGVAVTIPAQAPVEIAGQYQNTSVSEQSVLGERVNFQIAPTFNGVAQVISSQANNSVYLFSVEEIGPATTPTAPTITVNGPIAGDNLTFRFVRDSYQTVLTAGVDFAIGGSDAATASNLAAAINASTSISQLMYAAATANTVQVYTRQSGSQTTLTSVLPYQLIFGPYSVVTSNNARFPVAGGGTSALLGTFTQSERIPQTGWFDVIDTRTAAPGLSITDSNNVVNRVATFSYSGKQIVLDPATVSLRTKLLNVWGGSVLGDDITLSPSTQNYYASFRKADVLPNDRSGRTGTDYQQDTTEGFSARFNKLKFLQGSLDFSSDGVVIDLGGTNGFVKKRGDLMSGALSIFIDATLNPNYLNANGLNASGNGTGNGVVGTSGSTGGYGVGGFGGFGSDAAGVFGQGRGSGEGVRGIGGTTSLAAGYFSAAAGSNTDGVQGIAEGTGVGVYGVNDAFGGTGPGVKGYGRRGVVAESYNITDYPQARLVAQGTAVPAVGNRLKGDLWVPDDAGVDWDGHLLVYDGSNYLDAYASILSTQQLNAQRGGVKLISNYTTAAVASTLAEPSDLAMSASYAITASTGGSTTVVVSAAGHTFVAGDNVYITGATDTTINNTPPPATKPSNWKVQSVVAGVSFTIIINAVAVGSGVAAGTATKVYPHPMQYTSYLQSGGGGNGTLKFEHVYALPKSYKGLSSTASDVAVEFNHRLSGNSAGSTWTIYMARYRPGADYPVIASVKSGNYATGLFLQSTQVLVSDITASSLGATPFQAGDVVGIFIVASTVLGGCTVYIYEVDFNFCEAFYAVY